MSTAPVDHHELTVERLPRIGRRYELTGHDQQRVGVVIDTRGNRYISIHATGQPNTSGGDVVVLNEAQASLLSVILAGTYDQAEAVWSSSTHTPTGPDDGSTRRP